MKLTVLIDNTVILDKPLLGESGLSYLIETKDGKVVFDTGFSPIFLSNARKLGIDMTGVSAVAISHGHDDHCNGLPALGELLLRAGHRVPLVLHPACLQSKWWRNANGEIEKISMHADLDTLHKYYDVRPAEGLTKVLENLYFLGEIPRTYADASDPIGFVADQNSTLVPDRVTDDSAMVYDGPEGLVVINGCAHSGLVNILHQTKELFPDKPIAAVIGGFHMQNKSTAWLESTGDKIKLYRPAKIYPCHCTDEASRAYLRGRFQVGQIGTGSVLTFK
jgi:7,8-dihydropterin-6-yl-methyl-4-(beta-D-ribofuranosyl)aminobenzene 5'-phosphate synthase